MALASRGRRVSGQQFLPLRGVLQRDAQFLERATFGGGEAARFAHFFTPKLLCNSLSRCVNASGVTSPFSVKLPRVTGSKNSW